MSAVLAEAKPATGMRLELDGITLSYHLRQPATELTLEILDRDSTLVRRYVKGLNPNPNPTAEEHWPDGTVKQTEPTTVREVISEESSATMREMLHQGQVRPTPPGRATPST